MIIKKLNCEDKSNSYLTVQLSYDEVRDIANTCYYATEFIPADQTKVKSNAVIAANMTKFLFDMIKHGNIQFETIQDMYMAKFDEDKSNPVDKNKSNSAKEDYYI